MLHQGRGSALLIVSRESDFCVQVYTLEKVLNLKKDPLSGVSFLDEALKVCVDIHIITGG